MKAATLFLILCTFHASARFEPTPIAQQMKKIPKAIKSLALPDGTLTRVTPTAVKVDSNLSVTVFPRGYWEKAARTNSAVLATQTFPSGLVMTTRIFTNQTGSGLIHVPRKSNGTNSIALPMLAVPAVQPYSFQSYWVPADSFQPEPTFNSDWQGFNSGTYQFQVMSDFINWRSLGQFTLSDPDPTIVEGFDVPVGPLQNFLPMIGGFVRVVKTQ